MTWPVVTLNDLKSQEPRAVTDGPFGSNLASRHYTETGPRVVRLQNIGDGRFIDARAHISLEHFNSLQAHEVRSGDLLIASLGEVLPRACLAPEWLGPAIVKADCIRVRLGDEVDARWVLYALQRPETRRWAEEHRHGVGRPRLGLKTIREIQIPLPPLDEQRRILGLLEEHLSRLGAAEKWLGNAVVRSHQLASSLRRQLVTSAITHDSGRELRNFASIDSGPAFKSSEFGAADEGISLLRGDNIEPGALRWATTKTFTGEMTPKLAALHIAQDDLILAMDRPVISTGLKLARARNQDLPALLVQRVARIRPNAEVLPEYLEEVLNERSFAQSLLAGQVGTQVPHITLEDIRNYSVPVPSLAVQRQLLARFSEAMNAVVDARRNAFKNNYMLQQLRRALLTAAFSDQLSAADAVVPSIGRPSKENKA